MQKERNAGYQLAVASVTRIKTKIKIKYTKIKDRTSSVEKDDQ